MKVLYLECKMGIAGDMMASSLLGLFEDKNSVIEALNAINIPNVVYKLDQVKKCGILGDHITVLIDGIEEGDEHGHEHHDHNDHHHSTLDDIEEIIEGLNISKEIRSDVREVYQILAQAESRVHGEPVSQIHFHEVGKMDAIADITAVCYLLHELDPDKIIVSPINVGNGTVKCAHGILPVPAPATAFILKEIPVYSAGIDGELCTPTGAALLKFFVQEYADMPAMTTRGIGYGMGSRDFPRANCMRAFLGERVLQSAGTDRVVELSCNMDDMTAERIAFATELLMAKGALEAFTVPVGMKKSRPGMLLTVVCTEAKRDEMVRLIFKHTTTIGVRENISRRFTLKRRMYEKESEFGPVRVKHSEGYGVVREKFEYEDLAAIARARDLSIEEVVKLLS